MPRPPLPPGQRRSRLRDADGETDNIQGYWRRERLIEMDREYCEAMRRAQEAATATVMDAQAD
jgi:transposase InsO family protein